MPRIVSFGHKHGDPVAINRVVLDVRHFRNPYSVKVLRGHTGLEPNVQAFISQFTRNFDELYAELKGQVQDVLARGMDVYIGCTGGHHRSVYLADRLAKELGVPVEHRDIDK